MSDNEPQPRKPTQLKWLLIVLAIAAAAWGATTVARRLMPPDPLIAARDALEVGEFDQAIEHYRQHLENHPEDWSVRGELGLVLAQIDRPRALAEFRKVPTDSEIYPDALRQIVGICLKSERLDEARKVLEELTELVTDDWWPQLTLAELHFRERRPAEALPYAEKSSELNPHARGRLLLDRRDPGRIAASRGDDRSAAESAGPADR